MNMEWTKSRKPVLLGAALLLVPALFYRTAAHRTAATHFALHEDVDTIALLLPDDAAVTDPRVTVWTDAAAEEGLHMEAVTDGEFLRSVDPGHQYAAVVMPDQVHKTASNALVKALGEYVRHNGRLMLVYDAGTLNKNGTYAWGRSRLSTLVGTDYAMYDHLRENTIRWGPVWGTARAMDTLNLPPGKYAPVHADERRAAANRLAAGGDVCGITGYIYGFLQYPSFTTGERYSGSVLLSSPEAGLVAGYKPYGEGGVLFANLPLGYLKGQTDGALLHGMLEYFARDILHLPILAAVPDGTGGMVMNWHIDSNAATIPIGELERSGLYSQGPYSIHITAGPDAHDIGDHLGLNVPGNPVIQKWIRSLKGRGYEVGSHGGWIHDYFAHRANENNRAGFQKYLALNKDAIQNASGSPVTEYSAPAGNQPGWTTDWLEEHGVLAYYFSGNTGTAPTRSYRDGRLENRRIWSFPISSYSKAGSFEEMSGMEISNEEAAAWLSSLADFTTRHRVSRLFYFHPRGAVLYEAAMREWLQHTAALRADGRFRWYTMTQLARFLNAREHVHWRATEGRDNERLFDAVSDQSLEGQTWLLPKSGFDKPDVLTGTADIHEDNDRWLVVAHEGQSLQFQARAHTAQ